MGIYKQLEGRMGTEEALRRSLKQLTDDNNRLERELDATKDAMRRTEAKRALADRDANRMQSEREAESAAGRKAIEASETGAREAELTLKSMLKSEESTRRTLEKGARAGEAARSRHDRRPPPTPAHRLVAPPRRAAPGPPGRGA